MKRLIGWVCVLNLLLTGFPGMARDAVQTQIQVPLERPEASQKDEVLLPRKDKKEDGCRKGLCSLPSPVKHELHIKPSVTADDKQTPEVKGEEHKNSRSADMNRRIEFFEEYSRAKSESSPQLARPPAHPQLSQQQNVTNTRTNDRPEIKTFEALVFQQQEREESHDEETDESWPPLPSHTQFAEMSITAGQEERRAEAEEPLADPETLPPPLGLAEALQQAWEQRKKDLSQNAAHHPESDESETDDEDDETGTEYDTESEWDNDSEISEETDEFGEESQETESQNSEWLTDEEGRQYQDSDEGRWYWDEGKRESYTYRNDLKVYFDEQERWYYEAENGQKFYYDESRQEWLPDEPTASPQDLLGSIREGVPLRKVAPDLKQEPVDPRGDFLKSIQKGIKLKPVDHSTPHKNQKLRTETETETKTVTEPEQEQQNPVSPLPGLGNAISNAISQHSTEESDSPEETDEVDDGDDEDWEDDAESLEAAVERKIAEDQRHKDFIAKERKAAAEKAKQEKENGETPEKASTSRPKTHSKVNKLTAYFENGGQGDVSQGEDSDVEREADQEDDENLHLLLTSEEEEDSDLQSQTVTQELSFFQQLENLPPAERETARVAHMQAWLAPKEVIIEESAGIIFATEQNGACVVHHDDPTSSYSSIPDNNFEEPRSKGSSDAQNSGPSEDLTNHSDVAYIDSVAAEYDSYDVALAQSQEYDNAVAAYYAGDAATATVSEPETLLSPEGI